MNLNASNTGTWRLFSLAYGMKYGLSGRDRLRVLGGFVPYSRPLDYRLKTPYGLFHCPDVASAYQFKPRWEMPVREMIRSLEDGVFVDVGANLGFYSVLACKGGNRVISVEPNPTVASCLKENLENNCSPGKYTVHNVAAWKENGISHFDTPNRSGVGHISESGIVVQTRSVDSLLNGQIPDMIKIDAEGAEPEILEGMKSTLGRGPRVIFEALNASGLNRSRETLVAFHYEIQQIDSTNYLASPAR
ncbi:MAG: FkbM family methyltransferase [Thaumarchaeota archaeon]|nr:FkbM family methyltransferase [Nitrososphaerota archaeon]